eukprot:6184751-Pleurochrysis_carterae.AAC.2
MPTVCKLAGILDAHSADLAFDATENQILLGHESARKASMAGCDILLQGASYAALALTGCMITLQWDGFILTPISTRLLAQAVIALHDVLTTALPNFITMCETAPPAQS